MPDFHPLAIKTITRETAKAVVLEFDIPDSLQSTYQFIAGQYITIKTEVNGKKLRRAYSLCSSPNSGKLSVAVKEVEGGTFSVIANNKLQVGKVLEVHPPEGKFVLATNPQNANTYCAFAAGSGITPIMSMIKSILEEEPNSNFVLVYGNRSPKETIFFKELLKLQLDYEDRLFVEFVYSRTQEENSHFGRIEKSTINFVIKNKFKDANFTAFYLCGPSNMIDTVTAVLTENGIDKDRIYFELFTNSSDGGVIKAALDGKTSITVLVDDEKTTFEMDQKKTLLDAALEKDLDAPYSCQGGICSSCICRITEGKAIMQNNSILTDSELAEGLVLACQAYPVTPVLHVDFDDV